MDSVVKILILCLLGLPGSIAVAYERCYSNSVFRNCDDIRALIHKAAVYGDFDKRQIEDDYAATNNMNREELKAKVASTGKITCFNAKGTLKVEATAQLTNNSSVITTAAHVFHNLKTCREIGVAKRCAFTYKFKGVENSIKAASLEGSGFKCPGGPQHSANDWAVLKLEAPAKGPIPYRINKDQGPILSSPQDIVNVAAFSVDFCVRDSNSKCIRDPKTKKFTLPKYVENCQIKQVYGGFPPVSFSSDCDSSIGTSGSSILESDLTYPTLIGILVGGQESEESGEQSVLTGDLHKAPYDEENWSNYQVPIAGDFLRTILKASQEPVSF